MPVVGEMMNLSSELHRHAIAAYIRKPGTRASLPRADPMFRDKKLSQLWVNYRWSPIVMDERFPKDGIDTARNPFGVEGDDLHAGDRAPDVTMLLDANSLQNDLERSSLSSTTLHNVLSPSLHTLIVFASHDLSESSLIRFAKYRDLGVLSVVLVVPSAKSFDDLGADKILIDCSNTAYNAYAPSLDDSSSNYVVVRPDMIIGALGSDTGIVDRYFSSILRDIDWVCQSNSRTCRMKLANARFSIHLSPTSPRRSGNSKDTTSSSRISCTISTARMVMQGIDHERFHTGELTYERTCFPIWYSSTSGGNGRCLRPGSPYSHHTEVSDHRL